MISTRGFLVVFATMLFLSPCSADSLDEAFTLLKNNQSQKAKDLAQKQLANRNRRKALSELRERHLVMLSALAQLHYEFSQASPNSGATERALKRIKSLESKLKTRDAFFLTQCSSQMPRILRPYCSRWLEIARSKARSMENVDDYVRAQASKDPITRAIATSAIVRVLSQGRKRVRDGGRLTSKERALFQSRLLINALIDQVSDEKPKPDLDAAPALETGQGTWNGRAIHGLILIESPAIERLELAARAGNKRASLTIKRIKKAQERRLRRHPKSRWDSAVAPKEKAPAKSKAPEKKEKDP